MTTYIIQDQYLKGKENAVTQALSKNTYIPWCFLRKSVSRPQRLPTSSHRTGGYTLWRNQSPLDAPCKASVYPWVWICSKQRNGSHCSPPLTACPQPTLLHLPRPLHPRTYTLHPLSCCLLIASKPYRKMSHILRSFTFPDPFLFYDQTWTVLNCRGKRNHDLWWIENTTSKYEFYQGIS